MKRTIKAILLVLAVSLVGSVWAEIVEVSTWADLKSNLESGKSVKLIADITQDATWISSTSSMAVDLDLNGHKIYQGYYVGYSRAVRIVYDDGGCVNLTIKDSVGGGEIIGSYYSTNDSKGGGGFYLGNNISHLTLSGGKLSGFKAVGDWTLGGGCIYITSGSLFMMSGGEIVECIAVSGPGGAVHTENNSSFVMTGGVIRNCRANMGGGVGVAKGGFFQFSGGEITENFSAGKGGGIIVNSTASLTISGGVISSNIAENADCGGGGIMSSGRLFMLGGTITDNISSNADATAICSDTETDMIRGGVINGTIDRQVEDALKIEGGVFDHDPSSLVNYLYGYECVAVGEQYIVGNSIAYDADNELTCGTYTFCPTNAEYVAAGVTVATNVTVTSPSDMQYVLKATGSVDCSTWAQVKLNLENGNSVRLVHDVTQDVSGGAILVPASADVVLDLNGYTVSAQGSGGFIGMQSVGADNVFTLKDSVGTGVVVGENANIFVGVGRKFVMEGGTIAGSSMSIEGGAVCNLGAFTMNGGMITNCSTTVNGGAVFNSDTFIMNDGVIAGCSSLTNGGAVCNTGTFTMNAGTIKNCTAGADGGAVWSSGTFMKNGGTISGSASAGYGNAIRSTSSSSLAISGGLIIDNMGAHAGAISIQAGIFGGPTFNVSGGVMRGNSSDESGTDAAGRNIKSGRATIVITGGVFDSEPSAGNILCGSEGTFTIGSYSLVGADYVVGKLIAYDTDNLLTGGIYTFNPTNAEYLTEGDFIASYAALTIVGDTYILNATNIVDCDSWKLAKINLESGNDVILTQDVEQDKLSTGECASLATMNMDVTLDLNGHTVTCYGSRLVTLESTGFGMSFTLKDSVGTGVVKGGIADDGGCVWVGPGNTFVMEGGTITENTASNCGGGVFVSSGATMVFNGGEIFCNEVRYFLNGGGIASNGRLTMNGGRIYGNKASSLSEALYSNADDSDIIYGGVIYGSICRQNVGDLVVNGGVFDRDQTALLARGKSCVQIGANYIVGTNVTVNANAELMTGTFTFCPTNAEYVAVGVAISENAYLRENATEPKTWTVCLEGFLAVPAQIAYATSSVYTNGVLSAETSSGSGEWYAWSNGTATVVYTAEPGYFFEGGAMAVTNFLDTTVNPAVNASDLPDVLMQVTYVDEKGELQTTNAHPVVASGSRVTWNTGWYVVTGHQLISRGAKVNGAVNLILADKSFLGLNSYDVAGSNAGIEVSGSGNSFALYGQTMGNGQLSAFGGNGGAGIGGNAESPGGNITINGCGVSVLGHHGGAGIGGGSGGRCSNIVINGGYVTARCGEDGGAGIGGGGLVWDPNGFAGYCENITINGGTVVAEASGEGGAGIGGGGGFGYHSAGDVTNITINGGVVSARSYHEGAGIGGGGYRGDASGIMITGGTITAIGGVGSNDYSPPGQGIGCGQYGNCSNIRVTDNVVIRAGKLMEPTTVVVRHEDPMTDVASALADKRCANVTEVAEVTTWSDLRSKLEASRDVKVVDDIDQGLDGAVQLESMSMDVVLDLNGHTLTLNTANRLVTIGQTETNMIFTLTDYVGGGIITGGGEEYGGCVWVGANNSFVMSGGLITNCVAGKEGGAIYNEGTATINGGAFVDNLAGTDSTALFGGSGTTTVNGGVSDSNLIGEKKASSQECSSVGSRYIVGTNILCDGGGRLTCGTYTFCPTNAEYAAAGLLIAPNATVTTSGSTYTLQTTAEPTDWENLKVNLEAGNCVKLTQNILQNAQGVVINGKAVTLDLNGYTIAGAEQADVAYRPFTLSNGARLTLTDSSDAQAGVINGHGFALNGTGGCVYIGSGCVFTMTGGKITNCAAETGGGVTVASGGVFNLLGGALTENMAKQYGGGVFVASEATMNFSGGEIARNTADGNEVGGGGIVSSGRVTMSGGKITENNSRISESTAFCSNMDDSDLIYGGVVDGTICRIDSSDLLIFGGVFTCDQSSLVASGKSCTQVGSYWVVGTNITCDANNKLTGGTYTFCPTNAEYEAKLSIGETIRVCENETDPKTWSLIDMVILAEPTQIANATAAVYTNGVLSSETSFGSGKWYVWSNEPAIVVYTAEDGYSFGGDVMVYTNHLDTTVNPAVNVDDPPEILPQFEYLDENGVMRTSGSHVISSSASQVTWAEGWYVVTNEVTIVGGINVSGAVHLILADDGKLTINGVRNDAAGIAVTGDSNSFVVYGQTKGTGSLSVVGGNSSAGIGGGNTVAGRNITINGGHVTAMGGAYAAGIGGGCEGAGLNITINGGVVTATGGNRAAGIGGGMHCAVGSHIMINGGIVTATGGSELVSGVGSGKDSGSSEVYVATNVILKAGESANPTEVIPHMDAGQDMASALANLRYVLTDTITVIYPAYLDGCDDDMKAKFSVWAASYGSTDPEGIYTNAFLLNVATNREDEAVAEFKIESIVVTNNIVNIEISKPLEPATFFNGEVWLQCVTNLPAAESDWKDVGNEFPVDGQHGLFLRSRIGLEHVLTPEVSSMELKGMSVIVILQR